MKHIPNNISESEKKEILSKYDGSLKVKINKFTKLVESRLGDVKLHESSQPDSGQQASSGIKGENVKYRNCNSKKTFTLGCMDTRQKTSNEIMKLQECLGVTADGKFGMKTLKKLLELSPETGGVVRIDKIEDICSNSQNT